LNANEKKKESEKQAFGSADGEQVMRKREEWEDETRQPSKRGVAYDGDVLIRNTQPRFASIRGTF